MQSHIKEKTRLFFRAFSRFRFLWAFFSALRSFSVERVFFTEEGGSSFRETETRRLALGCSKAPVIRSFWSMFTLNPVEPWSWPR